ncbi:MAG: 8-oxo-dGTP pyrophosphatase MutT (NUDIX family) [Sphingobacteriales bacterium]|jgi:8-oxo-dGTP pyrophosphatase MutT (NUDIX family)
MYDGVHGGQMAFPGGKMEPEDYFPHGTAERETWEEIGLLKEDIQWITEITPVFIPPSGFLVVPILGLTNANDFKPDPTEVHEIVQVPMDYLLRDSAIQTTQVQLANGQSISTPAFVYHDYIIWGATAMMVSEIREFILAKMKA